MGEIVDSAAVNMSVVFIVGTIGVFVISTAIAAIVWNLINRWFRSNNGNRRTDNIPDWPSQMLIKLDAIHMSTSLMASMFERNGFARSADVEDIKRMLRECQLIHNKKEQ